LFSIWGTAVEDARVLDLFAGSGAVAIEALSQGAREAVAAEVAPRAVAVLRAAVRQLGLDGALEVLAGELPESLGALVAVGRRFDLVFADPPYAFAEHGALLAAVYPLLAVGGEVAVEHGARGELPVVAAGLVRVRCRRYGETALSFYRRESEE
jgi:16S rRNA (guanine(966)-N(2))-methyltransferase RsmD